MSGSDALATVPPALPTVKTDDGPITVVSLEYLDRTLADLEKSSAGVKARADGLSKQAAEARARAGPILVAKKAEWNSAERDGRIQAAESLAQLVTKLELGIADVKARPHHGVGGVIDRVKDSSEASHLQKQLESAQNELLNRYRDVADHLEPHTGVSDADELLSQAADAAAQADASAASLTRMQAEIAQLKEELSRRKDVMHELGFDALGIQADLDLNGIRPVQSNLVLKKNEVAAKAVPATLCRFATQTRYVGGSQGVSIPLGHGFRYRISSYRGHPIQSQQLARVDIGQLVVTSQRLVFLGGKRDVSTPLAKLLQVEPYSDAIGIGREGKESRDIYLTERPAEVLLYLNWVIGHQA